MSGYIGDDGSFGVIPSLLVYRWTTPRSWIEALAIPATYL
jgi:phosphatidylserine synthase